MKINPGCKLCLYVKKCRKKEKHSPQKEVCYRWVPAYTKGDSYSSDPYDRVWNDDRKIKKADFGTF